VQPALVIAAMHSQHAWIMAQQSLSPLVQVMMQPFSVMSHLHIPIIRLQQHTIKPFITMQQPHMPPLSIMQRFCSMPADIASSQVQVIFIPPRHFSIVIVHRGTIIMFMPVDIDAAPPIIAVLMLGAPMPGALCPARSITLVAIRLAPEVSGTSFAGSGRGTRHERRAQYGQAKALVQ
jgi:hypothetical protein